MTASIKLLPDVWELSGSYKEVSNTTRLAPHPLLTLADTGSYDVIFLHTHSGDTEEMLQPLAGHWVSTPRGLDDQIWLQDICLFS